MSNSIVIQDLPLWKKIMYALGQFGWSLAAFNVGSTLIYFYLPPESINIGPFVSQGYVVPMLKWNGVVVFGLTIIGLVFATGRLFDGITDPLIAGLSDKCGLKLGKRRSFLAIAVLPFAVLSALVFFPPVAGISIWNTVWLFTTVLLFYWFMTMYVTPFFALLSELGHSPNERLQLSTFISVTWALGTIVGSQIYTIQGIFERMLEPATAQALDAYNSSLSALTTGLVSGSDAYIAAKNTLGAMPSFGCSQTAFQIGVSIFGVIAFILMLLPIIFIDEKKYCETNVSKESILNSVISAFKNKNFRMFTFSDFFYWVSITIINSVLVYYITVLLGLPKENTSGLIAVMFILSFLFYVPVNLIAKKIGKKMILCIAFIWFGVVFLYTTGLGTYPFSKEVQSLLIVLLAAIPLAIFGIVQNAIVADIAEADAIETGNFKAGIFFGARTFMSKMGQTIAGLTIPALLIIGAEAPTATAVVKDLSSGGAMAGSLGVRLTGVVAVVFCLIGFILFLFYNEKSVLSILARKEKLSPEELKEINGNK